MADTDPNEIIEIEHAGVEAHGRVRRLSFDAVWKDLGWKEVRPESAARRAEAKEDANK